MLIQKDEVLSLRMVEVEHWIECSDRNIRHVTKSSFVCQSSNKVLAVLARRGNIASYAYVKIVVDHLNVDIVLPLISICLRITCGAERLPREL